MPPRWRPASGRYARSRARLTATAGGAHLGWEARRAEVGARARTSARGGCVPMRPSEPRRAPSWARAAWMRRGWPQRWRTRTSTRIRRESRARHTAHPCSRRYPAALWTTRSRRSWPRHAARHGSHASRSRRREPTCRPWRPSRDHRACGKRYRSPATKAGAAARSTARHSRDELPRSDPCGGDDRRDTPTTGYSYSGCSVPGSGVSGVGKPD